MWAVSAPVLQGKRMTAVITVPSPLVRAPAPLQDKLLRQVRAAAQALNEAAVAARRPNRALPGRRPQVILPACRTSAM